MRREPFVSLARVFIACGITPIEGLLRFPEVAKSYDTTLGGIAPFTDLWVPLRLARQVVAELGRLDELEQLLAWESRRAWTVEDREEGALLHKLSRLCRPEFFQAADRRTCFEQLAHRFGTSRVRRLQHAQHAQVRRGRGPTS